MKIDLHIHTKRTKSGESEARNVAPSKFAEVLSANGVGIAAYTNHNYFSLEDFELYSAAAKDKGIDVWPGIELDVDVDGEDGHILFICNPDDVKLFSKRTHILLGTTDPNNFIMPIENIINEFDSLDLIIIAHNSMKDHGFSDRACKKIKSLISNKCPVLFEPSSLKSVGILFAHDICGFIGSDVKDWNNYPSNKVPELKIDIEGFESFKLLLKKDNQAIKTFLDQKKTNLVTISPFADEGDITSITLKLKEDINIIYGGKGTGKTKIIDALKAYFEKKLGLPNVKYYAGKTTNSDYNTLVKRTPDSKYFNVFEKNNCHEEIKAIKEWASPSIITTNAFYVAIKENKGKGSFSKFGFSKASFDKVIDDESYAKEKNDYDKIIKAINSINSINLSSYLNEKDLDHVKKAIATIVLNVKESFRKKYISAKASQLTKWTIDSMKSIALAKTGNHSIPSSTGLIGVFTKCLELFNNSKKILDTVKTKHYSQKDDIGYLPGKGMVFVQTDVYLNPNESTSIDYVPGKPTATTLKSASKYLTCIKENAFSKSAGEFIKNFNSVASKIIDLSDFAGIKSFQSIRDINNFERQYTPSSGEQSMLLLNNALISDEAKVYLLDEPELSVGHKYVNDVIVPRLIDLSRMDKIVVISTHDSNIAVRTLPLVSIYREDHKTYQGSLFTDSLQREDGDEKSWVETSLDCLEGGLLAFDERSKSYGKQ